MNVKTSPFKILVVINVIIKPKYLNTYKFLIETSRGR